MNDSQKGSSLVVPVIGGVAVVALVVGAFLYWKPAEVPTPSPDLVQKDKDNGKDKNDPKEEKKDTVPTGQLAAYESPPVSLIAATEFLYAGANPVQVGLKKDAIKPNRAAALRGQVYAKQQDPLPGVSVGIQNQPAYGVSHSRTDGTYDMVVNGGGLLTVGFRYEGYLPVWRQTAVPWQDYTWLPPVVMTTADTAVTKIQAKSTTPQVARASAVKDKDGERKTTLFFAKGTGAILEMPDGTKKPLTELNVRATEYTVGDNGPQRMPAPLPANSGYTYCVELNADEAIKEGAKSVVFDKPVYHYVENFLNFPIGIPVPTGYFDPEKAAWVPSQSGRVIKILNIKNAAADIDVDGKGQAADEKALKTLAVSDDERQELAKLYKVGASLWRVPIPHFSVWDCNWAFSPPEDAVAPRQPIPKTDEPDDPKQTIRKSFDVPGVGPSLNYNSARTLGGLATRPVRIPLTGKDITKSLKRVVLEVLVAGRRFELEFPAEPNLVHTFNWDGKDAFGRTLGTSQSVTIRIGYVYAGVYERNDRFGASGNGQVITGSKTRQEVVLWQEYLFALHYFDARQLGLGGWSFATQHVYDTLGRTLYLGNGDRHGVKTTGLAQNLIIDTVAGGGKDGGLGDDGPALQARLDNPMQGPGSGTARRRDSKSMRGLAIAPDGAIFIADSNARIRRVDADGKITTIAGGGKNSGNRGLAIDMYLQNPGAIALGPDGSLFIAEGDYTHRITKVDPKGMLTTIAGGNGQNFAGDGGDALKAKFKFPTGIAVAPDGTLYVADQGSHRIRRITTDGIITTIAGDGKQGYRGDGGPALTAQLYWPTALVLGPDGSLYFSDSGNYVIRRISPAGTITTVAGLFRPEWESAFDGDGGPALKAKLSDPTGLAIAADGTLYVADTANHRIRRIGPDGIISTLAGINVKDPGDFGGDNGPATQAKLSYPTGLALGPDGSVYFYDASEQRGGDKTPARQHIKQRIRRITPPLPGFSNNELAIKSPDGKELFKFNAVGQHLETRDVLTAEVRQRFEYDKAGWLTKVANGSGPVVTIERDEKGRAVSIAGPSGQKTTVELDAHSYLKTLTFLDGKQVRISHSPDGLLQEIVTPSGYKSAAEPQSVQDKSKQRVWQVIASGVTDDLYGVAFASDLVGVAVGAKQTFLRTTDGGKSWKRIMKPEAGEPLESVIFADDKLGYVRNGYTGGLFRTKDAGATWEPFVNPNPSGLSSIKGFATHAAHGNTYYWMNYAGFFSSLALYKTEDAKNWTRLWDHENQTLGGSGASMVFVDANEAWMASTTHPGAKMWVGRSSDGGKTWTSREIKENVRGGYMLIQAVDKDRGWFCSAYANHVHASTDGGKTWTPYELGNGGANTIRALQFLDAKTGYVLCGEDWHVRQTNDGGKSWNSLGSLKPPANVASVCFRPNGTGCVVGAIGYIARFE